MESFYFLIPIALVFVALALRFLFWAIHSGQYDNLDTEAHRILFDEDAAVKKNQPSTAVQEDQPGVSAAIKPPQSPLPDKRSSHD